MNLALGLLSPDDLITDPWLCVGFRVVNLQEHFQSITHAAPTFFHLHATAERMPILIEPGSIIETTRLHDQCVAFPMSNGISIPFGIRVFRKLSPVHPDRAPQVVPFEELKDPVRSLDKLHVLPPDGI